jgi:hypothetical protein
MRRVLVLLTALSLAGARDLIAAGRSVEGASDAPASTEVDADWTVVACPPRRFTGDQPHDRGVRPERPAQWGDLDPPPGAAHNGSPQANLPSGTCLPPPCVEAAEAVCGPDAGWSEAA